MDGNGKADFMKTLPATVFTDGVTELQIKAYDYQVRLADYHTFTGSVVVDDPENTHKVVVNLLPNFGWIEVSGVPSGKTQIPRGSKMLLSKFL